MGVGGSFVGFPPGIDGFDEDDDGYGKRDEYVVDGAGGIGGESSCSVQFGSILFGRGGRQENVRAGSGPRRDFAFFLLAF